MSFFIRKNGLSKNLNSPKLAKVKKKDSKKEVGTGVKKFEDEEILSESDEDEGKRKREESSDNEDVETAQEKKLRLTKLYLEEIEKEERERAAASAVHHDVVAHRLQEEVLEERGRLRRRVADMYSAADELNIRVLRCKHHKLPVTCVVISADDRHIFSSSKDCSIVKWSLEEGRRLGQIERGKKGHTQHILCLAISTDSKFLVSGCSGKVINVWNPDTLAHIHTFQGHRGAITGLVFRRATHELFSCSSDRSVKLWNLDEMAYVETLFGHQDGVTSIDALTRERAITAGGRDNTLRVWKIVEESQLVFNGHQGSIDMVRLVNDEHFVSCGDDGCLCLWGIMKKKPLCVLPAAHGVSPENKEANWVSSVASLQNTDLVASGSWDGQIKLWKCAENFRSLSQLFSIPVVGFVNSLSFSSSGDHLVAGVGQEHRLGRWWRVKEARNSVLVIPLRRASRT